jgi:hypothetical protein
VLGYRFWQRYFNGDPAIVGAQHSTGAQNLSDRGRYAAAFSAGARQRSTSLSRSRSIRISTWRDPEDPPRGNLGSGERRAAAPLSSSSRSRRRPATPTVSAWNCAALQICMPSRWGRRSTCCSARSHRC